VHAAKLEQVTNFTIVSGAAKHCIDQYMVLFHYCLVGGDTAMPGGLNARLSHAFLVIYFLLFLESTYEQRSHELLDGSSPNFYCWQHYISPELWG